MSVDTFDDDEDGQDDATNAQAISDEEPGSRYSSVYDGIAGHGPGDEGRTMVTRAPHPPLYCPNPRIMPSPRGLYRCPCCGFKIRHSSHIPVRERAYENVDYFGEYAIDGIRQAWDVAWPSLKTSVSWTARAIAWMARAAWNLTIRHREGNDSADSPDTVPDRPDNGHENAEIACTTSDGIHVMKHENGREKCLICGITLVREGAENGSRND